MHLNVHVLVTHTKVKHMPKFNNKIVMHLSIEIPTPPPPPRAKAGECGGFLWHLKARFARGGWGISQHLHLHLHIHRGEQSGI